jgi:flagellar motor switch/type III secretory pathway protein FliN
MAEKEPASRLENVVDLEVPVAVVLAWRSFPLAEILDIRPGSILEFARRYDQPLDLCVNGARVGSGRAVEVGERLGLLVDTVDEVVSSGPSLS